MTDIPVPPSNDRTPTPSTRSLKAETEQFEIEYLQLARAFGQVDIEIAREFARILVVLRTAVEANPQLLFGRAADLQADSSEAHPTLDPSVAAKLDLDLDFIKSIITKIVEFLLGDKQFFLDVIKLIKCGCPPK